MYTSRFPHLSGTCGFSVDGAYVPERFGIVDRSFCARRRSEILAFSELADYLDEKRSYSRVLDDRGEPTEAIEARETYHLLDAERYVMGWINRTGKVGLSGPAKSVPRVEVRRSVSVEYPRTGGGFWK
jgi:hypothetical protein